MPRHYEADNGVSLTFTKGGSYRYPLIVRTSDGVPVRHWHNRPFDGRVADAVAAFREVAKRGCSLEGINSRENMSPEQVKFLQALNALFIGGAGGCCVVAAQEESA